MRISFKSLKIDNISHFLIYKFYFKNIALIKNYKINFLNNKKKLIKKLYSQNEIC